MIEVRTEIEISSRGNPPRPTNSLIRRMAAENPRGSPVYAARCLRSLSGHISSIAMRFVAEDVMFFGKSNGLLKLRITLTFPLRIGEIAAVDLTE